MEAAKYSVHDSLRDGRPVEIRALRPQDRDGLVAAVKRASPGSLYLRFFAVKRSFSEQEIEFFSRVDFVTHVALVAVVESAGTASIVAGGRYVVTAPGEAELAFVVIDAYQRQGLGAALMRHLCAIARAAGLRRLVADVLAVNTGMLMVFESCGLAMSTSSEGDTVHVTIQLPER